MLRNKNQTTLQMHKKKMLSYSVRTLFKYCLVSVLLILCVKETICDVFITCPTHMRHRCSALPVELLG